MYQLFRWAARVVPRLPGWLLYLLPNIIAPLAWLLAGRARRQATMNMVHVLGPEIKQTRAGRRKLRHMVRRMFYHSMSNYLETFILPGLTPQDHQKRAHSIHLEYVEEALALGKGVILVSAHFGPFEYLAQWFAFNNYQVVIPVERLKDERMLRLMLDLRSSSGVNYIPLGGSAPMRTIFQALQKNQIVLITGDRAVEGESVIKDFFNAPARLPIGPAKLSIRTGAPIVAAFGWRTSATHMIGDFAPVTLALPEEERKQVDLVEAALIEKMELFISAHPEQWVVFEPVWVESDKGSSPA